jgi:hypothetical protein
MKRQLSLSDGTHKIMMIEFSIYFEFVRKEETKKTKVE